nr:MAG TPA: hypothetical protein [Crassvirales sp.]
MFTFLITSSTTLLFIYLFFKVYNNPLSRLVLCQSYVSITPTIAFHYRRFTPRALYPQPFLIYIGVLL